MEPSQPPPPDARLMQAMFGFMVSKGLSVAATLNVADALADGPRYYADIAKSVGADQRSLHRVLRMLASVGIFTEPEPGKYGLNEVSELLRTDHPSSMRDMATMITSDSHWLPWGKLGETVRSGKSGPQHAFGTDLFSWFQDTPNRAEWEIFNAAMTSFSSGVSIQVAEAYDFSAARKIVDIGGGHGHFLRAILNTVPDAKGAVFDLPGVVEGTDTLGGRIEPVAGSFFDDTLPTGDTYLLKHILHDWADETSTTILRKIVDAMESNAKVLVVETIMPETTAPHPAKFMDVNMLAMTEGGCERSEAEYRELFATAGLRLTRIVPTKGPISIVEAIKA